MNKTTYIVLSIILFGLLSLILIGLAVAVPFITTTKACDQGFGDGLECYLSKHQYALITGPAMVEFSDYASGFDIKMKLGEYEWIENSIKDGDFVVKYTLEEGEVLEAELVNLYEPIHSTSISVIVNKTSVESYPSLKTFNYGNETLMVMLIVFAILSGVTAIAFWVYK